jgi:hypothetical protein
MVASSGNLLAQLSYGRIKLVVSNVSLRPAELRALKNDCISFPVLGDAHCIESSGNLPAYGVIKGIAV